jgi:hypothetical protein
VRPMRFVLPVLASAVALAGAGAAGPARGASGPSLVRWSGPRLVDHAPPFGTSPFIASVACPTVTTCLGVGGEGTVVSTTLSAATPAPAPTATTGVGDGAALQDISCPSASLCVAAGTQNLQVSGDPTDPQPRWRRVHLRLGINAFDGVTCPTAGLCVAWLDSNTLRVSTDPAGGASTWRRVPLPIGRHDALYSVGCARGGTLCVASVRDGRHGAGFVTTTDPAGGAAAWHLTDAKDLFESDRIVCPTSSLCVAMGDVVGPIPGRLLETSTDPAGGASTWHRSRLRLRSGVGEFDMSMDCATASDCVIALSDGSVASTTDAAAGASAYTESAVIDPRQFGELDGMACPTATACVIPAVPAGLTTVDLGPPVTGASARGVAGSTQITGLACPTLSLCIGVDHAGAILRTSRPAGPAAGWERTAQPRHQPLFGVSCPTASFCAAAGAHDTVLTTTSPATATTWKRTRLKQTYEIEDQDPPGPFRFELESISCPSTRLCVAGTDFQGVVVSTHPAAGPSAWRYQQVVSGDHQIFDAVSCPTTSLCVAGDDEGEIGISTRPGARRNAWTSFAITPGRTGPGIRSLACPTVELCVAGETDGAIDTTTRPAAGPRAWRRLRLGGGSLRGAWCRSAHFCIVAGGTHAWASTDPTGPRRDWHRVTLATDRFHLGSISNSRLLAVTCAPTRLCLAAGGTGSVFPGAG